MVENEMNALNRIIPTDILAHVERLRPILKEQGAVLRRNDGGPRTHYRLRYRQQDEEKGYPVHKALSLGDDPSVARAVAELLSCWRREADLDQLDTLREEQARRAEEHRLNRRRKAVRAAVATHGLGERVLRRAMRMLRGANDGGPCELWSFAQSAKFLKRKQPGRPRKLLW